MAADTFRRLSARLAGGAPFPVEPRASPHDQSAGTMPMFSAVRQGVTARAAKWALDEAALLDGGGDEGAEQRVRLERPALELGVVLHADEPGVVAVLHGLGQQPVG
jgi:hypothetical protein